MPLGPYQFTVLYQRRLNSPPLPVPFICALPCLAFILAAAKLHFIVFYQTTTIKTYYSYYPFTYFSHGVAPCARLLINK